jgi:hypothetical protein
VPTWMAISYCLPVRLSEMLRVSFGTQRVLGKA